MARRLAPPQEHGVKRRSTSPYPDLAGFGPVDMALVARTRSGTPWTYQVVRSPPSRIVKKLEHVNPTAPCTTEL